MKTKKILGIALAVCMTMGLTTVPAMAEDKKTFVFGDTTFNAENEEADINPQNTYAGWACTVSYTHLTLPTTSRV